MKRLVGLLALTTWCCCLWGSAQDVTVTAQISAAGTRDADLANAAVWLTPLDHPIANGALAHPRQQLVQKNKSFSPHVLIVPLGSSVEFPNQDPFFHNVFSLFDGKRFDLGLYEAGSTRSVVFNRAGVSYIFCNIHPEMSAVVISVKTQYYALSDKKGLVSIPNVPAGRYEMQVWHERVLPETLNTLTRTVAISPAANSLGTVRLAEQRSPTETHKNKYGEDYDTKAISTSGYSRP